jgi:hypothetical protein
MGKVKREWLISEPGGVLEAMSTVPGDWSISEPGKPLRMGSTLDSTPIPTDWEDIHELWGDMKKFASEHPNHTFISMDDPGFNYDPVRVPRLGWSARLKVGLGGDEQAKAWTITISNVKKTFRGREDLIPTPANRRTQLQELNKPQGEPSSGSDSQG